MGVIRALVQHVSALVSAVMVAALALVAIPALANVRAPEKHPGSCVAIFNETTSIVNVRVVTPTGYSGTVWKIGRADIMQTSMGVTLTTPRGPIVSSEGEWDITVDPANLSKHWDWIPVKAKSCSGTWSVSVGVPAG
jgi:hypothetical protein